jgi:tRNA C32,U32 (ribose-2'-O)-methylase TrmJ
MRNATVRELTLLIGSERDGLPEELTGRADRIVHIPIQSQSLNAAMAATVALYELPNLLPRRLRLLLGSGDIGRCRSSHGRGRLG